MGDSLCDMFLKEHEKFLPIHGMIQASAVKPKTPYQLDLAVKDRKPSIVPKVGDKVKIKSWEWYETWKNEIGGIRMDTTSCVFVNDMAYLCGKVLTVQYVTGEGDSKRWRFDMDCHYWVPEFFEEVYPVQEQLSSKFPRIDLSCPLPLQSPYEVKGSELVISKEEQERLKQQLRDKWGVKPKLKQIKTTHLIKLKKL